MLSKISNDERHINYYVPRGIGKMINTFENFKTLATMVENGTTFEELSEMYKKDRRPEYIAYVYIKLFKGMHQVSQVCSQINSADKASYLVETIHKTLLTYNMDKPYKYSTFLRTSYKNRLISEYRSLTSNKNSANYQADSYESMLDAGQYNPDYSDNHSNIEIEEILETTNLTENERKVCKVIIRDSHIPANFEIADEIGITQAGVAYILKSLRAKLKPQLCLV